jgi:hypothetical protein
MWIVSVAEVAKRTPWTERSLKDDCHAGVLDHINRKGAIGFTHEQLDALLERYRREGSGEEPSAAEREADELAAARAYNAQTQTRGGIKRVA